MIPIPLLIQHLLQYQANSLGDQVHSDRVPSCQCPVPKHVTDCQVTQNLFPGKDFHFFIINIYKHLRQMGVSKGKVRIDQVKALGTWAHRHLVALALGH